MKPSEAYRTAIQAVCTNWCAGRISTDDLLPTLLTLTARWDSELFNEAQEALDLERDGKEEPAHVDSH